MGANSGRASFKRYLSFPRDTRIGRKESARYTLNQILAGLVFEWGDNVPCELAAHGGCVNYVVPPLKNLSFWVSIPCFGDIATTGNPPDELVFSAPMAKVEALLGGMEQRSSYRGGLPIRYKMEAEGWLPEAYFEIARIMKMHRAAE